LVSGIPVVRGWFATSLLPTPSCLPPSLPRPRCALRAETAWRCRGTPCVPIRNSCMIGDCLTATLPAIETGCALR
jgi:hypothetical protein